MSDERRPSASLPVARAPFGAGLTGPPVLMTLLFFSGAAALADEVVWTRMLAEVFGTTAGAAAVVVACFMAGMGVGGLFFGRLADRGVNGLRLYGLLEIAGGLAAGLVPILVRLSGYVYGPLFRLSAGTQAGAGEGDWWVLTPARIALSSIVLLGPSFALGGTLPALVRFVVRSSAESRELAGFEMGRLYAANTAGSVVGCFVAGFVLVKALGILGTVYVAAGASVTVGVMALVVARRVLPSQDVGPDEGGPEAPPAAEAPAGAAPYRRWIVPALYGASGFAALGCEVIWTRALVFLLRTTVYAFTSMLGVFLVGLAAGGAVGASAARRARRPAVWFALVELGVGLSVALGLAIFRALAADWDSLDVALSSGWGTAKLLHVGISAAVMLAPTFLLGMAFPLAGRLHAAALPERGGVPAPVGAATGELILGNTAGGVIGSLAAGFVMLPLIGTGYTLLALACVSVFVAAGAFALLVRARRELKVRAVVGAALVCATILLVAPAEAVTRLFAAPISEARLVFAAEEPSGIVTVHEYPKGDEKAGHRVLSVSGIQVAGTGPLVRSTQVLQGLIPALMHPSPRRILQVGLGSGETSYVALSGGAGSLHCVEIAGGVVEAARGFFLAGNNGVLDDARFSLTLADGKNYLAFMRGEFDLVLSESTYPFLTGSSALYTLDYYRDGLARLAPGGMMTAWLPLDVPDEGLRTLVGTFAAAFPHATLWTTNRYGYKHALLVGSREPIRIDFRRFASRAAEPWAARALGLVGIASPEELVASLMLDESGMRAYGAGAPLHTDNFPVLEYQTSLRSGRHWRVRLAENFEKLNPHRVETLKLVSLESWPADERGAVEARLRAAAERARRQAIACPFLERARHAQMLGKKDEAAALYARAVAIDPANVEAIEEAGMLLIELGRIEDARSLDPAIRGAVEP